MDLPQVREVQGLERVKSKDGGLNCMIKDLLFFYVWQMKNGCRFWSLMYGHNLDFLNLLLPHGWPFPLMQQTMNLLKVRIPHNIITKVGMEVEKYIEITYYQGKGMGWDLANHEWDRCSHVRISPVLPFLLISRKVKYSILK